MTGPRVAGVDGCRRSWVVATQAASGRGAVRVEVVNDFERVMAQVDAGELTAVGVDMPIGLSPSGGRVCDRDARRLLGPRRSSVFSPPARPLLAASTWADVAPLAQQLGVPRLSRQAFGIVAKIREVDAAMTPVRRDKVAEVHPEASFAGMAGWPMGHPKRTPAGRLERVATLATARIDGPVHERTPPGAAPDDVLDALAVLWTVRRWVAGRADRLGDGARDAAGLRMEIVV